MTGPIENNEVIEKIEQQESPEVQDQLKAMYVENMQASEQAGNEDMVKYYQEKLNELEAQNEASDDIRLGGWYAGYTAGEWRNWAKKEYIKNGNSIQYRKYCDNAIKAENN